MLKLQTPVTFPPSRVKISYTDRILLIGSCFASSIGEKLRQCGFDVLVNPFGTLYNPVSVSNALGRLSSGVPFTEEDCVEMGAGAGLVCSFSHHTSFARKTSEEFLLNANRSLGEASAFFASCDKIIITLGTSWCYRHGDEIVSNCLKRNASEFTRERLSIGATTSILSRIVERYCSDDPSGRWTGKDMIFTVSPIRHLKDTAHGNQLSKAGLLLAVDEVLSKYGEKGMVEYFPSYEIVLDELRDYRFYAEDMVHPSEQAIAYIWERFLEFALKEGDGEKVKEGMKAYLRSAHRPMH